MKSLTQHVFVTGSTGCGKSETIYKLISETKQVGAKFLVIEPAKGEYKNVFGDVNVFGTNPLIMPLLRINPFSFPTDVHVLEHIDRLTEIFNVCWPMYSAMPAVLKKLCSMLMNAVVGICDCPSTDCHKVRMFIPLSLICSSLWKRLLPTLHIQKK